MSLPNRSHSIAEMTTFNGNRHHQQQQPGLMHSNSANNNPLLNQRSFSYIKTINENQFQSTTNEEPQFRVDKYDTVRTQTSFSP